MTAEQERKKQVYVILFAFLVLVTVLSFSNQNGLSGAFHKGQSTIEGETLVVPCDRVGAEDLVDLLVDNYACRAEYCKDVFFAQPLPGDVTVVVQCASAAEKDLFLNACKSAYRSAC